MPVLWMMREEAQASRGMHGMGGCAAVGEGSGQGAE